MQTSSSHQVPQCWRHPWTSRKGSEGEETTHPPPRAGQCHQRGQDAGEEDSQAEERGKLHGRNPGLTRINQKSLLLNKSVGVARLKSYTKAWQVQGLCQGGWCTCSSIVMHGLAECPKDLYALEGESETTSSCHCVGASGQVLVGDPAQ